MSNISEVSVQVFIGWPFLRPRNNRSFQVIQIKIWILNMEKEQQLIVDVESFSKENSCILVVTQICDR